MRKLALDIGLARIGVASSHGTLVLPHSALTNDSKSVEAVANLYAEISASCCYVGLPLSLSGEHTKSTSMAIDFAAKLADRGLEIRLIDERLTTKSASSALRETGRDARSQKGLIDAAAAAVILEFALASEKAGELAGKRLEDVSA